MYPFASFLLILNVLYLTITYQKTGTLVFRSFFFNYYYFVFLMKLFQDGLLERQEVLQWILDLLDRLKLPNNEDGLSRLLLSLALQYLHEFVQSEQLSRKLVYLCARKISSMCSLSNNSANTTIDRMKMTISYTTGENDSNCVVNTRYIVRVVFFIKRGSNSLLNFSEVGVSRLGSAAAGRYCMMESSTSEVFTPPYTKMNPSGDKVTHNKWW